MALAMLAPLLAVVGVSPASATEKAVALGGTVSYQDGAPASDVTITLFEAVNRWNRGAFLGPAFSADDGSYDFEVEPDTCYILVAIAPDGTSFVSVDAGQRYSQIYACSGDSNLGVDFRLYRELGSPDTDQDSKPDDVDTDDDNDGLLDTEEAGLGTDPLNPDTDGDGVQDGTELGRTAVTPDNSQGPNPFIPDADPSTTTDPVDADTDGDGLSDGEEDPNFDGASPATIGGTGTDGSGETDPNNPDTDGDGLTDGDEVNNVGTDPLDTDTDDGTVDDGTEVANGTEPVNTPGDDVPAGDNDGDGIPDDVDTDDDNDGLLDTEEAGLGTDPLNPDTDGDGVQDGTELGRTAVTPDNSQGPNPFIPDADPSTTTDPVDADTDGDGLSDGEEDPNFDGASPATIGGTGTDGSGETDPNNPDTDGDGLTDGDEVNNVGTDPLDTDTDDGTVDDGTEVANGTEPVNTPGDDVPAGDNDGDGIPDNIDTDDDNDGLPDTVEPSLGTDPLNPDTDGDGVQDGTEVGVRFATGDSFGGPNPFIPDADPSTTTDPLNPDTDGDGLSDGEEDPNFDGASPATIGGTGTDGSGETDPNNPDTDGDGLTDGDEVNNVGTDPLDTDTDDGTVDDGTEVANGTEPINTPGDDVPAGDNDGDGIPDNIDTDDDNDGLPDTVEPSLGTDPLNPDTDGDGVQDGTEVGVRFATGDSFGGPNPFIPDADPSTTTDPLNPDTDGDGLSDGEEDPNFDGASPATIGGTGTDGSGETDPNNPDTDGDGLTDGDEVNNVGTDPLDTDTDDGTVDDGTEVANGTEPINTPSDDVAAPIVATIIGDDTIAEKGSGTYRVQLDSPAPVDLTFRIDTVDGTANRTSQIVNQSLSYSWCKPFAYFIETCSNDDFLVWTPDGNPASGGFNVTVPAGQTVSDSFSISAFGEQQLAVSRGLVRRGLTSDPVEDTEDFVIDIVRVVNAPDTVEFTLVDRTVNITDTTNYYFYSPIALDLNGDGEIGVTGQHTARGAVRTELGATVEFDIDADGTIDTIEWFAGDGDGILVDVNEIGADGSIDGSALFGDQGGQFANGYEKLAQATGAELGLWIDDGDAVLEAGELVSLADAGVASVSTDMVMDDEGRMRSTATMADGSVIMTEDVWFAGE